MNVSKKQHRFNDEFNIILLSEMLVWNCFRLLIAKFTTISLTMTLKREIIFPAKKRTLYHGGHYNDHTMETGEPGINFFFILDEQHIQVYLTFQGITKALYLQLMFCKLSLPHLWVNMTGYTLNTKKVLLICYIFQAILKNGCVIQITH